MRKTLIKLHMYLGLVIGLLLAMIGLTGSVIVFGEEIDRSLNPQLLRVEERNERASAQSMLEAVRQAYPGEKLSRIRLPHEADDSAEICFEAKHNPRCVYVDPYSATILGERVPAQSFKGRVVSLHRRLLSGETGETIIGICGLLLLTLSVSGLVLWWPGRKSSSRRLRIKRGGGSYRTNFDLHRIVGVCAMLFLAVNAATGAAMVFRPTFEKTLNRFSSSSAQTARVEKPVSTPIEATAPLSLDDALSRARAAMPDAVITSVNLPATPTAPYVVRQRQSSEWHPSGRTLVYLDQYSGAVLRLENPHSAPAGTRAGNNLFPIHTGRLGGFATRVLLVLVGFTPALLFTTGFMMWLNHLGRSRRARQKRLVQHEAIEAAGNL
jgi:uncharacterized iron-regulated membrane protein